jgi:predicted KAP-like P-loop ATPase
VRFKRKNTPTSPDYENQRNNLNQILNSLDNPIIVIIDDLDRVSLEQCKQIFQLIYLCSDLKNVHFLVSYDSEKFNSIDVPTFVTHSKVQKLSNYTEYRSAPITEYIKKIIHEPIIVIPSIL